MDMFDEARAIEGMIKLLGKTQSEIAKELGVSQSYIANKLRLLGFSATLIEKIRQRGLSERHARSILRLDSEEARGKMIDEVASRSLTVRECEALVDAAALVKVTEEFSRGEALSRIAGVENMISRAVEHLIAGGVSAEARTSYCGADMYITLHIKGA